MTGTYVEIFKQLLAKGYSHEEALKEFDRDAMVDAMWADMPKGASRELAFELLDLMSLAGRERRNREDLENQAIPLWGAGWTSDAGQPTRDVFSWYWRAPAKGKRPLGRKYFSTQQAFNAYQKQLTQ